jgi:hypothetical protein
MIIIKLWSKWDDFMKQGTSHYIQYSLIIPQNNFPLKSGYLWQIVQLRLLVILHTKYEKSHMRLS